MKNHFTDHLNVKGLIERYNPQLVVEAGCGDSTVQLLALQKERGFRLVLIDVLDNPAAPGSMRLVPGILTQGVLEGADLLYGVSYLNFEQFEDGQIDMVMVDTDHNGWTLARELAVLERKVKEDGIVILHDTEAFKDKNGIMECYASGEIPYPKAAIEAGPTMGEIVEEYKQKWAVVAESVECNGAIAFQVKGQ